MRANILNKIIAQKQKEVAWLKAHRPSRKLEQAAFFSRPTYSLTKSLRNKDSSGIISEFKRRSPSKGIINAEARVGDVAVAYEAAGAAGMSILTDQEFFGGHVRDLMLARKYSNIPLLRKDFVIDDYQIMEAKALGADVILLIAAALTPQEVQDLAQFACSLDLEVLLEVHNAQELEEYFCEYVHILGVNNRNLKTFEVSLETSYELAEMIPEEVVKISESGLHQVEDLQKLRKVGYEGFLMGEYFMQQSKPGEALKAFIQELSPQRYAN